MSVFYGPSARGARAQHRQNISETEARRVTNAMHVVNYRKTQRLGGDA